MAITFMLFHEDVHMKGILLAGSRACIHVVDHGTIPGIMVHPITPIHQDTRNIKVYSANTLHYSTICGRFATYPI